VALSEITVVSQPHKAPGQGFFLWSLVELLDVSPTLGHYGLGEDIRVFPAMAGEV